MTRLEKTLSAFILALLGLTAGLIYGQAGQEAYQPLFFKTVADPGTCQPGNFYFRVDTGALSKCGTSGTLVAITDAGTSLTNAAADGTTKGVAAFTAADFNSASGVISIDYSNGQAADGSHKGFLPSADWTLFNPPGSTVTASGTACTITGITKGFVTAGSCT